MGTRVTFQSGGARLLFEGLNRLLVGRGYRRRGTTWYSDAHDLIRVFSFDPHPTWRPFALGIYLHALDRVPDPSVWDTIGPRVRCRATHPQIEDCAVSVGLQDLVEDRARFVGLTKFLVRNVSGLEAVPQIVQVVSDVALPLLETFQTVNDVRRAVQSEGKCKSSLKIRESAKAILSCI
jgi:hypothetical protein